jgi:hypothetical protein
MEYYKSEDNQVYAFESEGFQESWLKPGFIHITEAEAEAIVNPPPTLEQLQKQAKDESWLMIKSIREKIEPLQDAVYLGVATEEEKALLATWYRYRLALYRLDVSTAPDILWPEQPK